MRKSLVFMAILVAAPVPVGAQSVREGIEAWQQGDHATAIAIWVPLARRGDADAAFNLGQTYRLGKGVPVDLARSKAYLEQAARKGHIDAAANLGILMFQAGDRTRAIRWVKQAANGGEPRSLLLYGVALYNGDGMPADPVSGYAYVSRAAAQGFGSAKETLAEMDAAMPREQRSAGVAQALAMVDARREPALPPADKVMARPATAARPVRSTSGKWRMQLGAFGKRSAAEALFARIRAKVAPQQPFYIPAGSVVRLQVGPYRNRAEAAAACATLSGQACFPVEVK